MVQKWENWCVQTLPGRFWYFVESFSIGCNVKSSFKRIDTKKEREEFMSESTKICAEAKFNLRDWVWNEGEVIAGDVTGVGSPECGLVAGSSPSQETFTSVLGLLWNVGKDTLSLYMRKLRNFEDKTITK